MFIKNINRVNNAKLANSITSFRLLLGLPIILFLIYDNIFIAWILIVIGGLSDWLDGWVARRTNSLSKWGAQFDPLADKVMVLVPLLWLLKNNIIPLWSIWLLISRELIVTAWRRNDSNGAPASYAAKIKTSLQFISILLLLPSLTIIGSNYAQLIRNIGLIFFYLSLIMSFISAYNYFNSQLD